ncbi:MAG: energy-coupled thiamine transporter ThiT [Clostridia bacterium]|nr:energy-coupled thiamine transporter ThiT [Clostridia bacterium]
MSFQEWFSDLFSKFAKLRWEDWMLLAVLVIAAILVLSDRKLSRRNKWTPKRLAVGGICLSLAVVLGLIRLWRMPMGGSITPAAMLPLMIFAAFYGLRAGILLGVLYGLIDLTFGSVSISIANPMSFLLDYIFAYGAMGLCALTMPELPRDEKKLRVRFVTGIVIACAVRFLFSFLSGWLVFPEYAPENTAPIIYSLAYNGTYMGPNCVICAVLGWIVGPRIFREMKKIA